jgi:hypothetical protein
MLRAAGAPLASVLPAFEAHAAALRKGGNVHAALRAVLDMQRNVQGDRAAAGAAAPWWQIEEAKVLWALGQHRLAVRVLDALVVSSDHGKLPGALWMKRSYVLQSCTCVWAVIASEVVCIA